MATMRDSGSGPVARMAPTGLRYPPTIGVDPGQTWTAAVLRVDDHAEHGWTIGPTDANDTVIREALNDPDAWQAFAHYCARLSEGLSALHDYARSAYGEVRVAVEVPQIPIGYRPGSHKKFNRLRLCDWVVPRQVAAAVLGQYPDAVVVPPDHYGARPASEYPSEIRGRPPEGWGPSEARGGERQHERAAYDIAGKAMTMPVRPRRGSR